MLVIVGIERAPATVAALHSLDPFQRSSDRFGEGRAICAIHRHGHDGGVVEVGIISVFILERPAAGAKAGALVGPVADDIEHLALAQPVERLSRSSLRILAADFEHRVRGERGVPHRRNARLAVDFVVGDHQQLVDCGPGSGAGGVIGWVAERVEHHHRIGHRRIDRSQPVLAVEPLDHPVATVINRAAPKRLGPQAGTSSEDRVEQVEPPAPVPLHRLRLAAQPSGLAAEQFVDHHLLGIARARLQRAQHQQRDDHRPRPVGHFAQMNREPARREDQFGRDIGHRFP